MTRGSTELFDCARVNDYLESYLSGQVPPPERRGMRLHIHGCAACHLKVLERDPLQFFAPLADQQRERRDGRSGDPWEGFADGIRAGISAAMERSHRSRLRAGILAAAAMLALVAVGLAAFVFVSNRPRPVLVESKAPEPPLAQASLSYGPSPQPGPFPQTVERVRGTGGGQVQVYTMNYYLDEPAAGSQVSDGAGKHGQTAELVLIVDARLEL